MKTIICSRRRLALYTTLLVIITGCTLPPPPPSTQSTPSSFSCASFTESLWKEFRFGVDSPDDVVATATRLWGIERDQVQVRLTFSGDEVFDVRWWSDAIIGTGGNYLVWFSAGRKLAKISVTWGRPKPTLAQIIDCLGFPEHYIAFYDAGPDATYLSLALFYPDSGIVVRYFNPSLWVTLPIIHPAMRMERFVVVAPGDAETMVTDMYSYGVEVPFHVRSGCLMRPWPGSIEAMEIASEDEQIRCGVTP